MAKKKELEDLRGKSEDELDEAVVALKKEAFNLRFQAATGQLENTSRFRQIRREIARIKTVRQQQKASAAVGADA